MIFIKTTYRTIRGLKEILEIPLKKSTQWVIYQDKEPKYYVDFFDLKTESNVMLNSLILCDKRPFQEVLNIVNKKNNVSLSIPEISPTWLKIRIKSEVKKLDLPPIPQEWLDYNL